MTAKQGQDYAMHRGRVRSLITGEVGNLVDWMPGQYCKVFTGYDKDLAGYVRMPIFKTWQKQDTVPEANSVPVGAFPNRSTDDRQVAGLEVQS